MKNTDKIIDKTKEKTNKKVSSNNKNKSTKTVKKQIENKELKKKIIDVELEIEKEEEKNNKKKKWLLLLLLLFLFVFASLGLTYSINEGFRDKIQENVINTLKIDTPTRPEIDGGSREWSKRQVIKVVKDAKSYSGIKYYEYCVSSDKDFSDCDWKKTETKNMVSSTTGKYFVVFRGVSNNGKIGSNSNIEETWIDNEGPTITELNIDNTKNGIKVSVGAEDIHSGVDSYYYKLDNGEYKKVKATFDVKLDEEREYEITIKVVDKLGNYKEVSKKFVYDLEDEDKVCKLNCDTNGDGKCDLNCDTDGDGKCDTKCDGKGNDDDDDTTGKEPEPSASPKPSDEPKPSPSASATPNPSDSPNPTTTPTPSPTPDENEEDEFVPEINLDKVPLEFFYGESYELPSYYKFGPSGGTVVCRVGEKEVKNTTELGTGKQLIKCEAIGNNGITTRVEKEVYVKPLEGKEEEFDGWITLTLYYPANSTDWQWRIGREDEVRTGYNNTGWQDYTGPILVRIEDVSNVYIRYKIGDDIIVQAPDGKVAVDIVPERYTLNKGEKTKVEIYYDSTVEKKEYRIGTGVWKEYTGSFEVGVNTIIEARGTKTERVYDSDGNLFMEKKVTGTDSVFISELIDGPMPGGGSGSGTGTTPGGTLIGDGSGTGTTDDGGTITTPGPDDKPSYRLEGPIITSSNEELAHDTTISITTKEEARSIYYSIDGGVYKKYTEPFVLTSNCYIRSYYIRESDGKTSETTVKRINNLRGYNLPYLKIIADPDPMTGKLVESVNVSLYAEDYEKLEYSLDGIYYRNYGGSFTVRENTTVYGKATNINGSTIETLVINNVVDPTPKEELEIDIIIPGHDGLSTSTDVTINYDSRATTKLYKIGSNGSWQEYKGTFNVSKNTTIYAYATSENGLGSETRNINFLYEGITDPEIDANPRSAKSSKVKVTINYDKSAVVKKYRLNNGELRDYTGSFEVNENNTTIYAYSKDSLGNVGESTYTITNISPDLPVLIFEYEMYYLIKLNYPSTSNPSDREYKWKVDGEWKVYNPDGILLIKPEYKDQIVTPEGEFLVKIEDENGKLLDFEGHWYLLDVSLRELSEHLFMRWNSEEPEAPEIVVSDTNWTTKVNVGINYSSAAVKKQYKMVTSDGESTGWLDYSGMITVEENNTTIYARYQDRLGVWSKTAVGVISNIDLNKPVVSGVNVEKITSSTVTLKVNGLDSQSGINYYYYSSDGENYIGSTSNTYTLRYLKANTKYTLYVKVEDNVGNKSDVYTLEAKTANINNPVITINPDKDTWSKEKTITISHSDSEISLFYSLDYGLTWEKYESPFVLKENSNIIAKATDGTNVSFSDSYDIETIDNTSPEINNVSVIERSSRLLVEVDSVEDMTEVVSYYYSLDGETYTETTDNKYIFTDLLMNTEYTVYVKTKNTVGLMSDVYILKATTKEIGDINYNISPDNETWAYTKEVSIDYPSEEEDTYKREYSLDGGNTWVSYVNPVLIEEEDQTIIARVVDGKNVKVASSFKITKIDRTIPTISLDDLPSKFNTTDNYSLPSSYYVDLSKSGGGASCSVNGVVYKSISELPGGIYTIDCTVTTGAGKESTVSKEVDVFRQELLKVDSILEGLQNEDLTTGYYIFEVETESETVTYPIHLYEFDGNQVWTENQTFGDNNDIASKDSNAMRMVVVKVNGDLTINEGVTVGPYYTEYGGPKGFTLYVTGTLTNNGTIDNSHGAKAEGQNVYLWANADGTYEYVPAEGGAGGDSVTSADWVKNVGKAGVAGSNRGTGGGGSGAAYGGSTSGVGGTGTSYSGGTGSGAAYGGSGDCTTSDASSLGGAGTNTCGSFTGGGAGNPGGSGSVKGTNGTGGLLTIYANSYVNNGVVSANGSNGGINSYGGGSSGGGSINIFTNQDTGIDQLGIITNTRYDEIKGSTSNLGGIASGETTGGAGGAGTVNIGEIRDGQYYDLKEIIEQDKEAYKKSVTLEGDSILEILSRDTIKSGYWYLSVNDEEYSSHIYVLDGDQIWSENQIFGDVNDVGTANDYAQNMVIVKVNGNITIDSGVTVTAYGNSYGGPKGLTLYVAGTLTNNGEISMTARGAKAEGQNVYLWANADGTYEYVPAEGGAGGAKIGPGKSIKSAGKVGTSGSGRQTGGGGSGAVRSSSSYSGGSGTGGTGTSYSGGTGSGGTYSNGSSYTSADGSSVGGAGSSRGSSYGSAGVGNPSGGTGGLLTIYANSYINNGILSSEGTTAASANYGGGSSGGGSINIFYTSDVTKGTTEVTGGSAVGTSQKGGAGGAGTVTYTQIDVSASYSLKKTVDNPTITLDTSDWTLEKQVTISYPSGYTNQYSLDSGLTWQEYLSPITVDKNCTVIARVVDNDEVVSSSTFTITKIEEETSISLEIPDTILVGSDITLPTSVTGGTGVCSVNEKEIINISELGVGTYTIMCNVTSNAGNKKEISKEVEIYEVINPPAIENNTVEESLGE